MICLSGNPNPEMDPILNLAAGANVNKSTLRDAIKDSYVPFEGPRENSLKSEEEERGWKELRHEYEQHKERELVLCCCWIERQWLCNHSETFDFHHRRRRFQPPTLHTMYTRPGAVAGSLYFGLMQDYIRFHYSLGLATGNVGKTEGVSITDEGFVDKKSREMLKWPAESPFEKTNCHS